MKMGNRFCEISKKKWVVQGFNSCLNYIMHGPVSSIVGCNKYLGYGYTEQLFIFKKDYLEYHYLEKDFINVGNEFLKRWSESKEYFEEILRKNDELNKKSFSVNEEVSRLNLKKLKDEILISWFHKIADAYTAPIGYSHLLEGTSYVVEPLIRSKLSKHLGINHKEKKFREIFSALMQPSKSSWVGEVNLEIMNITKEVKKVPNVRELFEKERSMTIWNKLPQNIKDKITEHKNKFFYNQLNYTHADGLNEIDYIKEIKNFIIDDVDIDEKINEENERYDINNKRRKELIEKHKLPHDIIDLVELILTCLHWQDDRKMHMLSSVYYIHKVLKEIGKRFNISIEMLKRYSWQETTLEKLKNFDYEDAEKRIDKYVVYFSGGKDGLKEEFYTGKDFEKFMKIYDKGHIAETHLHGMCASMGKAMGKVRICRTKEDIAKFEKGEILVSMMTRPEFVPAMKKASAIITDEGGITSHAAILSRELGIPCVIGTKTATKVFKDGDIVDVNANHGLVKKVE